MKKFLALFLALAMIMSFAACSSTDSSSNNDDDDNETKQTEKNEDKDTSPKIAHGKIEGAVYTNDFLGITFTRPDTWVYSTDAEIAAAVNLGVEFLGSEEKYKQALENNQTIYDMMVTDPVTHTNIQALIENLSKSMSTNMTEEQYISVLKTQLAAVTTMTVKFEANNTKVKLGETEYLRAVADVTANGVSMKQIYFVHKIDKYMAGIIVTIPSGYQIADVEAMFK